MEMLAWLCVAIFPIIFLVVFSVAVAGGFLGVIIGFVSTKNRRTLWVISIPVLIVGALPLLAHGIWRLAPQPTPEPVYKLADDSVKPLLQAINQSNRLALGFSPIPLEARIVIQHYTYNSTAAAYISVEPHTEWGSYTGWAISFAQNGNAYQWVGESEIYAGPNRYENIYIQYSTKQGWPYYTQQGDIPVNTLVVEYRGKDTRLKKTNLTLDDVRPILSEWKKTWETLTPEK